MRIKCKGYFTTATPECPSELECGYRGCEIDCDQCIINGGSYSPQTNKLFRGNPDPYVRAAQEYWNNYMKGRIENG